MFCSRVFSSVLSTHAGVLLQFVQQVFGGDEVVQQVAEAVMLVGGLQHREYLEGETRRQ